MVIGTVVLAGLGAGLWWLWKPLSILVLPLLAWLFAFFRDPDRKIPQERGVLVAPADGTVSDVGECPPHDLMPEPSLRVGIFLSVFNVHVNRAPCSGRVERVVYRRGKFLNALNHSGASEQNENNSILICERETRIPLCVVRQIVGLIARRIVCTVREGDLIERGQRFGMIKFGSRTELYVPLRLAPEALVQVGQKVRGGADALVRLGVAAGETHPLPSQAAVLPHG